MEFSVESIVRIGNKHKWFTIMIKSVDKEIKFFIRYASSHADIVVFFLLNELKCFKIDTWIENFRFSAIVFHNVRASSFTICEKIIHPLCSDKVSYSKSWKDYWHEDMSEEIPNFSEFQSFFIFMCITPKIPRRFMTVANMESFGFCNNCLALS